MLNINDIERIIKRQGYASYIDARVKVRGDGTTRSYVHLRGQGLRRPLHLGSISKLTQLSESDLVALIKSKTAKSAQ